VQSRFSIEVFSIAESEGQLSAAKAELASFSSVVASVFSSCEKELTEQQNELARAKQRLATCSSELQKAESRLIWLTKERYDREMQCLQFRAELEGMLSRCSNLSERDTDQQFIAEFEVMLSMCSNLPLEQDVVGLKESLDQQNLYTENCRQHAEACVQHVANLEERIVFLRECRSSNQKAQEKTQKVKPQLDTQHLESFFRFQTCRTVKQRLVFCSGQISKLCDYTRQTNQKFIEESSSINEIVQAMESRRQMMKAQYKAPVLGNLSLDFICWCLRRPLQLENPSAVVDKFFHQGLNGPTLLKVISNSTRPDGHQMVAKDLDDLLLDKLDITNMIERKRVVHMIQLLHFGLDPEAYSAPGCPNACSNLVCVWTPEKVQEKLKSFGLHDFVAPLRNVSGEVLLLLDLNRKDLDNIGITSIADQEKLRSLIKVLAQDDPVARLRNGGLLKNEVNLPHDDAYVAKGSENTSSLTMMTRVIPYSTIKEASGNFSDSHLLGSGGFGKVYRCDLIISQRKRSYAVKKMDKHSKQGHSEFSKEVEVLTYCRHPNLVPLVAVSMDPDEPCLIYPLMEGGNLRTRISQKDKPLSWQKRYTIGIEVLRAIVYLHQREPAILHRDIKPDNVLLDLHDHARLSDVGLARFMEGEGRRGAGNESALPQTSKLVGTFGYICPTFSSEGKYYPGSDGYGIGVLLLQLLSSKSAVDPDATARPRDLASKMRRAGYKATALAADPSAGLWSPAVAEKMASIALSLVQHDEVDRMECAEALKEMESSIPDWDTEHIPEPRGCIICMTENKDVRFLPCGHMLVCSNCIPSDYQSMDRFCYICKKKIDNVIQDFPQTTTFVNLPQ